MSLVTVTVGQDVGLGRNQSCYQWCYENISKTWY